MEEKKREAFPLAGAAFRVQEVPVGRCKDDCHSVDMAKAMQFFSAKECSKRTRLGASNQRLRRGRMLFFSIVLYLIGRSRVPGERKRTNARSELFARCSYHCRQRDTLAFLCLEAIQ